MQVRVNGMAMKTLFGVLLVISIIGNAILLYRVLDMGVTTTYQSDEIKQRGEQLEGIQKLWSSLLPNTSRADVLNAARKSGLEVLDKQEEGLYVDGIHFVFSGDQVTAVKFE
jgi:hypothetical protein